MNIQEAAEILAKQGVKVDKVGDNQFKVWYAGGQVCSPWSGADLKHVEGIWRGREVIKWARNPHRISKGDLKHHDNTKNRPSTRDAIQTENFDAVPNRNGKVNQSDPWSFD